MMFPRDVPECFTRDQGCTEAEWDRCLPAAVQPHALQRPAPGHARVPIGDGCLRLRWQVLPERRIALVRLPRLQVDFRFDQVDAAQRSAFMRRFDLVLQRGGG
jgi:hypothetical protein